MATITASPLALAFSALVTLIAVVVGAVLAAWARRDVANRNLRTNVAIALFNEFHAHSFIRYRHMAHDVLAADGADGFVKALPTCAAENQDALTTLVHFFEKTAVLHAQKKVDTQLLLGFLGAYIANYRTLFFAQDGMDEADPVWGDLVLRLKGFMALAQASSPSNPSPRKEA